MSRYIAGAAASGRRDPDTVTLATVRLTIVSVMTLPWTVMSPVISADHDTLSFADGVDVPIPTLDPEL